MPISPWVPDDAPDLEDLVASMRRASPGSPSELPDVQALSGVARSCRDGGGEAWVAREGHALVGVIGAEVVDENALAVRAFLVRPVDGEPGPAGMLLDTLVTWAKRHGYRSVLLSTSDERTSVLSQTIAEQGFVEIEDGRLPSDYIRPSARTRHYHRAVPGAVAIRAYNPQWPARFERLATALRAALADQLVTIEHTGSTAVPGLAAKPIIDIALTVPDSTDEPAYISRLEGAGFVFVMREPEWFEHRLFNRTWPRANIHVFSEGCDEVRRMILFRNWLRNDDADRELYETAKRRLADDDWETVQDYADAKTDVVTAIMERAAGQP